MTTGLLCGEAEDAHLRWCESALKGLVTHINSFIHLLIYLFTPALYSHTIQISSCVAFQQAMQLISNKLGCSVEHKMSKN